jgi:predicted DNA-binding transcriptional regulator YafY
VVDGDRAYDGLDHAFRSLLAYGAEAEVLAPQELRERIAAAAAETFALYSAAFDSAQPPGSPR